MTRKKTMRDGGNDRPVGDTGEPGGEWDGRSQNKKKKTTWKLPERPKFVKIVRVTCGGQMGGIHRKSGHQREHMQKGAIGGYM